MFKLNISNNIKLPSHGLTVTNHNMNFDQRKEVGDYWEKVFAENLINFGFRAKRPEQDFNTIEDKKRIAKGLKPIKKVSNLIYTKQQRDILIKVPDSIKRICVEVKSRSSAFKYDDTVIGKAETWQTKQFKVDYLAVIDQNTRECRITKADTKTRKLAWIIKNEKNLQDKCYAVWSSYLTRVRASQSGLTQGVRRI